MVYWLGLVLGVGLCWWCTLLILGFDFCFAFFAGGGFGFGLLHALFWWLFWVLSCFVLFLFVLVVGVSGVIGFGWVWVVLVVLLVVGGFWVDGLFVLFLVFCLCLFFWDLGFVLGVGVWLLFVW